MFYYPQYTIDAMTIDAMTTDAVTIDAMITDGVPNCYKTKIQSSIFKTLLPHWKQKALSSGNGVPHLLQ